MLYRLNFTFLLFSLVCLIPLPAKANVDPQTITIRTNETTYKFIPSGDIEFTSPFFGAHRGGTYAGKITVETDDTTLTRSKAANLVAKMSWAHMNAFPRVALNSVSGKIQLGNETVGLPGGVLYPEQEEIARGDFNEDRVIAYMEILSQAFVKEAYYKFLKANEDESYFTNLLYEELAKSSGKYAGLSKEKAVVTFIKDVVNDDSTIKNYFTQSISTSANTSFLFSAISYGMGTIKNVRVNIGGTVLGTFAVISDIASMWDTHYSAHQQKVFAESIAKMVLFGGASKMMIETFANEVLPHFDDPSLKCLFEYVTDDDGNFTRVIEGYLCSPAYYNINLRTTANAFSTATDLTALVADSAGVYASYVGLMITKTQLAAGASLPILTAKLKAATVCGGCVKLSALGAFAFNVSLAALAVDGSITIFDFADLEDEFNAKTLLTAALVSNIWEEIQSIADEIRSDFDLPKYDKMRQLTALVYSLQMGHHARLKALVSYDRGVMAKIGRLVSNLWLDLTSEKTSAEVVAILDEFDDECATLITDLTLLSKVAQRIEPYIEIKLPSKQLVLKSYSPASSSLDASSGLSFSVVVEDGDGTLVNDAVIKATTYFNGSYYGSPSFVYDNGAYKTTLQVPSSSGSFKLALHAEKSGYDDSFAKMILYPVFNKADGHDLEINLYDISGGSRYDFGDTVKASTLTVKNNGKYAEDVYGQMTVTGPNGYSHTGSRRRLGVVNPGSVEFFSNILIDSIPSNGAEGVYTVSVVIDNGIGDETPSNNAAEKVIFVGKRPPLNIVGIAAREIFVELHDLSVPGAFSDVGFGWIYYNVGGTSYKIGIIDDQKKKYGLVVYKNNRLIYKDVAFDADCYYHEPQYLDNGNLVVIVEKMGRDSMLVYCGRPTTRVGINPQLLSCLPGQEVEFEATIGTRPTSTFEKRDIFDARKRSNGEWDFDTNNPASDIILQDGDRTSTGYDVMISSNTVGTHEFVVELECDPDDDILNASISSSNRDDIVTHSTLYFLTGALKVLPYSDATISAISTNSPVTSGSSLSVNLTIANTGTLAPENLSAFVQIKDGSGILYSDVKPVSMGSNTLDFLTNQIVPGTYTLEVKVGSTNDRTPGNNVRSSTIQIDASPEVAMVVEENSNEWLQGTIIDGDVFTISIKAQDENNQTLPSASVIYELLDESGSVLSTGILKYDGTNSVYIGKIEASILATSIRITAGNSCMQTASSVRPLSFIPNMAPSCSIHYNGMILSGISPRVTEKDCEVMLMAQATDQDEDYPLDYEWRIEAPDATQVQKNGVIVGLPMDQLGIYNVTLITRDSKGKESTSFVQLESKATTATVVRKPSAPIAPIMLLLIN